MVSCSKAPVIEAGLKLDRRQSRGGIPISLKEGEEKFVELARCARAIGAAVVIMAFDEQGQADQLSARSEFARVPIMC